MHKHTHTQTHALTHRLPPQLVDLTFHNFLRCRLEMDVVIFLFGTWNTFTKIAHIHIRSPPHPLLSPLITTNLIVSVYTSSMTEFLDYSSEAFLKPTSTLSRTRDWACLAFRKVLLF